MVDTIDEPTVKSDKAVELKLLIHGYYTSVNNDQVLLCFIQAEKHCTGNCSFDHHVKQGAGSIAGQPKIVHSDK